MTQKQAQTIEQALARAAKEGIRILMRGRDRIANQRLWVVSAKGYEQNNKAYVVRQINETTLQCNCRAQSICKHRSVVHAELKAQAEELAQQQAEAERLASLPRTLANVEQSEEAKLEVLEEKALEREVKRIETPHWSVQLHRELDRQQEERSAKREAALLVDHTPETWSIFK